MRKKITLLLLLFVGFCATAQTINVKGIVKDAKTGDPLPGVSIIVKGTTVGTETDFDGLYSLAKVNKGATLVFNYLGYAAKEVVVNQQTVNVGLDESAESLDEIIVVGYGTQRKKEITGAVSVVSSETIENLKPVLLDITFFYYNLAINLPKVVNLLNCHLYIFILLQHERTFSRTRTPQNSRRLY